ncbi:hypothetical protein CDAR_481741 [Caerostris darwini]|uniref:Uncharacterized protein n=1 Tax=Caerostris darwini TaxID=1538125 RepID=A0AAV4UWU8_9ARAC|nr:hypothetical protein CDAR_481741 [Caerostris darwini]
METHSCSADRSACALGPQYDSGPTHQKLFRSLSSLLSRKLFQEIEITIRKRKHKKKLSRIIYEAHENKMKDFGSQVRFRFEDGRFFVSNKALQ